MSHATKSFFRIQLIIDDQYFHSLQFSGTENINESFCFTLKTHIDLKTDFKKLIDQSVTLQFVTAQKVLRQCHGYISETRLIDCLSEHQGIINITIESVLTILKRNNNEYVWHHKKIECIIKDLLNMILSFEFEIHFNFNTQYPTIDYLYKPPSENAYVFLHRLLSDYGIFYWEISDETKIHFYFTDHQYDFPFYDTITIPEFHIFDVAYHYNLTIQKIILIASDLHCIGQQRQFTACNINPLIPSYGENEYFMPFKYSNQWMQLKANRILESLHVNSHSINIQSNIVDLHPGMILNGALLPHTEQASDDYLILQIEHQYQYCVSDDFYYSQTLKAIPLYLNYRPKMHDFPEIESLLPATIKGNENFPSNLKDQYYQTEFRNVTTKPLPFITPFGGPMTDDTVGFHYPYYGGTSVFLNFIHGNPSDPIIIGACDKNNKGSSILNKNPNDYLLKTKSGAQLLLSDTEEKSGIHLSTPHNNQMISLSDAKGNSKMIFKNKKGIISFESDDIKIDSTSDICMISNVQQNFIAQENIYISTKKSSIAFSSKNDAFVEAMNHIEFKIDNQTIYESNSNLTIKSLNSIQITNNNFDIQSQEGNFYINARHGIHIESKETGSFKTQHYGFYSLDNQSLVINADTLSLHADEIIFHGNFMVHPS